MVRYESHDCPPDAILRMRISVHFVPDAAALPVPAVSFDANPQGFPGCGLMT